MKLSRMTLGAPFYMNDPDDEETLFYYDQPIFFYRKLQDGNVELFMLVEEKERPGVCWTQTFLRTLHTPEVFEALITNKMTVRDATLANLDFCFVHVNVRDWEVSHESYIRGIPESCLSEPGVYLMDDPINEKETEAETLS